MNPTKASMELLKSQGYVCEVVEIRMRHAKNTQDLFGVLDILALHPETGETVGVQTTTVSHQADRISKIEDSGMIPVFRACGWGIVVHGWRERGDCHRTWLLKPVQWSLPAPDPLPVSSAPES